MNNRYILKIGNDMRNWLEGNDIEWLLALAKYSATFLHCSIVLFDLVDNKIIYHN